MREDGAVGIGVRMNISKAERDLEKLKDKIGKLEDDLNAKSSNRDALKERLNEATKAADITKQKIEETKQAIEDMEKALRGDPDAIAYDPQTFQGLGEDLKHAQKDLAESEKLLKSQEKEVTTLGKEYEKVNQQIETGTKSLEKMQDQAGLMAKEIAKAKPGEMLAESFGHAQKKMMTFLKYAIGVRSVFFLFRRLRNAVVESVKAFAEHDEETKQNIADLKNALSALKMAWGAAFAPIFNAVIPALKTLIGWLISAANALARFFAILGGKSTYKKVIQNTNALTESLGGVSDAAKEAKTQLMGFDELNILENDQNSGGGGGGGGGSPGYEIVEEPVGGEEGSFWELLKQHIQELELWALNATLGIGLALLLTGANIPLGLGLIVASAIGLAKVIEPNWDAIKEKLGGTLGAIAMITSGLLFGIGLVLTLSGANIPLGLGCILAAGLLGANVVAMNWNDLPDNIRNAIVQIDEILGLSLAAIGAILCFTGVAIPLGIALMLGGAFLFGAGVAVEWNAMPKEIGEAIDATEEQTSRAGDVLLGGVINSIANTDFAPLGKFLARKLLVMVTDSVWLMPGWNIGKKIVDGIFKGKDDSKEKLESEFQDVGEDSGESYERGLGTWAEGAEDSLIFRVFGGTEQGLLAKIAAALGLTGGGKNKFEEMGEESGEGYEKGLSSWAATAEDSLVAKIFGPTEEGLIAKVARILGIASPSTVFEELGENTASGFQLGFETKWGQFITWIEGKWRDLKTWWSGLKLTAFTFHLPHLTVSWEPLNADSIIARFLGITAIPHLGVQWYAKGGVFDAPSLIGVGENGKEAVVPLEKNTEWITIVANGITDSLIKSDFANRLAEAFMSTPLPAAAGGGIVPPNALSGGYGGDWGSQLMSEIAALRGEIEALASQPIQVNSKLYMDKREVGRGVSEFQREESRRRG